MPLHRTLLCGGALALASSHAHAQSLPAALGRWAFDEAASPTTIATNTGTVTTPGLNLTMFNLDSVAADLRTAVDGLVRGVDGVGRALDLSSTPSQGNGFGPRANVGFAGNVAFNPTDYSALNGFTVTGWFNTADLRIDAASGAATLVRNFNTGTTRGGFQITTNTNASGDALRFTMGTGLTSPTVVDFDTTFGDTVLNQPDQWVFFAVTWDKNAPTAQLKWFVGDTDTAITATPNSTRDTPHSIANTTYSYFVLGRSGPNNGGNGFKGYLDDIRIYGSALTPTQLEAIRTDGVTPPADPASVPSPADTTTGVSLASSLTWTAGARATAHRIYLGTDSAAVAAATPASLEFKVEQATTAYAPTSLAESTTYFWRIDEVAGADITTGTVWSFTTAATPVDPYASWASGAGLTGDDALVTADPDADGRQNLLEYALGSSPSSPDSTSVGQAVSTPGGWVYRYTRPVGVAGITYTVASTTDLAAAPIVWTPTTQTVVSTASGIETVEAALPAPAPRVFARLQITQP
jgi:hypothetical protein